MVILFALSLSKSFREVALLSIVPTSNTSELKFWLLSTFTLPSLSNRLLVFNFLEVLHLIFFSRSANVGEYYSDDSLDLELISSRVVDSNSHFITYHNISNWLFELPQFIIILVNRSHFDIFLDPDILPSLLLVFSLEDKEDRSSYLHFF